MSIIKQESLFGIQELFDLEPTQRFHTVFSTIDIDSAVSAVSKKSWLDFTYNTRYITIFFLLLMLSMTYC
ncbi:hypothetical protein MEZE111188_20170 [Mesobacillus zeae]